MVSLLHLSIPSFSVHVVYSVGPGGRRSSSTYMSLPVWEVGEVSEGGEGGVSHGAWTGVQQLR